MCDCDLNGPATYGEIRRRARKQHRCCECRAHIAAGSVYLYCSGVWDGSGASYKRCLDCAELSTLLMKVGCCGTMGWLLGDASEVLSGATLDDDPSAEDEGRLGALLWLARERNAAA